MRYSGNSAPVAGTRANGAARSAASSGACAKFGGVSTPVVLASDANVATAVGAGTTAVGSAPPTSLAASGGAATVRVCVGAGETNITLSPPRSAAPAAAIETTTTTAVLTVRPLGTQGGSRNAFAGDSSGASAASHSEENGR